MPTVPGTPAPAQTGRPRPAHSLPDEGNAGVAQVSKPAVSPISKSAGCRNCVASARLETRDTADFATGLPMKYPDSCRKSPRFSPVPTGEGLAPKPAPARVFR
jgi:hypothetical protein